MLAGDATLGQFALRRAGGAFPVAEHHRPYRRDDQQCGHDLEGEDVVREQQPGDALDVAGAVGSPQPGRAGARDGRADREDDQPGEAEPQDHGRDPLPAQDFDQRVGRVDADQHDDEEEQHHDRAGVHDDLDHAEERRQSCTK